MRKLIFNADDYGLSPAVSRGIIESASGVVRSTTVMANMVTDAEIGWLASSALTAGAHLNISTGTPLTQDYPGELCTERGAFDKAKALDERTWRDRHDLRAAVINEWEAQLESLRGMGLGIGHLDSHHHTHMVGELFGAAIEFARRVDLPLRCRQLLRPSLRMHGIPGPDDLVESFFGYNNIDRAALLAALQLASGEAVEVMCHPGWVDETLRGRSGYVGERELELELLSSPELAAELGQLGWRLCGYEALTTAA